jgi:hypothetical protein
MLRTLLAAALFVPLILLLDGPTLARQLLLGAATAAFLWIVLRRTNVAAGAIGVAIVVATIGEVVLSMIWHLYSYRFTTLVPLYVPFGHGLFYTLAAATAAQPAMRRHEGAIVRVVLIAGSVIAIAQLVPLHDQWGMLWWIGAASLIAFSRNRMLLSVCCVYTMLLEWLGTALGNWRWAADVPGLHLSSANPPSGVGILYILLDLITVMIISARPLAYHWGTDDRTGTAEV